jgi:putative ABC transport system permease protein
MFKLALKNVWAKKLRLSLLMLIIMTSVGFISGTFILTDTINGTFNDLFNTVYRDTTAIVRGEKISKDSDEFSEGGRNRLNAALISKVKANPDVAGVEGVEQFFLTVLDKKGKVLQTGGAPTFGYNWNDTQGTNPFRMWKGDTPKAENELVITKFLADRGRFAVGEQVSIVVGDKPEKFTLSGIAKFGNADSGGGSFELLFATKTAQRLVSKGDTFPEFWVVGKPGLSQEKVQASVAATLSGERVNVATGKEVTKERQDAFGKFIGVIGTVLLGFGLVALMAGVIVIYNTFQILISQRIREIGLLRAIGASGQQMRRSVLAESLVVGLIGSIAGLAFGVLMALGLKGLFKAFGSDIQGSLVLNAKPFIIGLVVGLVATIACAYFPARKASKTSPMDALRSGALDKVGSSRVRVLIGVALTVAAVAALLIGLSGGKAALVGLAFFLTIVGAAALGPVVAPKVVGLLAKPLPRLRGVPGRLASENAVRNPRRTSGSALALTIGVSIVSFFVVLAGSVKATLGDAIDNQFKGDFIIEASTFGPGTGAISLDTANKIIATKGVGSSAVLQITNVAINEKRKLVMATNPETVGKLFEFGKIQGRFEDLGGETIAVKTEVAETNGWTLGSTIDTVFENGPAKLKVVTLYEKSDTLGTNYLIGTNTLPGRATNNLIFGVVVKVADGAKAADVRTALKTELNEFPTLKVRDQADFKKSRASQINGLLAFLSVLLVFAILIALIGIAITLSLSIFERVRELGVLRAVGQQRSQARSMVRWESVLIALFGTVLGLMIGTGFGAAVVRSLRSSGLTVLALPVTSLVVIGIAGALAGVVASLWPAYKASNTDIMLALAA